MLQETDATLATLQEMRALGVTHRHGRFRHRLFVVELSASVSVHKIKIDQSFVRELGEIRRAQPIVRTIADLGRSLGVPTIAEGVETPAQFGSCVRPGARRRRAFCSAVRFRSADVPAMIARRKAVAVHAA